MGSVMPETAGGPPQHGTHGGWQTHIRYKQQPCLLCSAARAQYKEDQRLAPLRRAVLDAEVGAYDRAHRGERPS